MADDPVEVTPESSILITTKKNLGLATEYVQFDLDIITHINAVFSVINQLGVGPDDGFIIEDDSAKWADLEIPANQLGIVKAYLYLKVRMQFDPPTSGFLIDAYNKMIQEYEWRLSNYRELLV